MRDGEGMVVEGGGNVRGGGWGRLELFGGDGDRGGIKAEGFFVHFLYFFDNDEITRKRKK